MSLMGGIAGGGSLPGAEDFMGEANESRKLAQQSAIMVLIVSIVAFAALMGMRMTQADTASASSASQETMAYLVQVAAKQENPQLMANDDLHDPDVIGEVLASAEEVIRVIKVDRTQKHVPLEQVKKNPFHRRVAAGPDGPTVDTGALAQKKRQQQLNGYYGELSRVQIQSLVGGARPRAFIGGELYKVGDTLGSFRIAAIDNRTVAFEVPGFELAPREAAFVLGIGDSQ